VRDCLHPADLATLLAAQFKAPDIGAADRIVNVGGGLASAKSLLQLSDWCMERFGAHSVASSPTPRPFDIPWIVLDASKANRVWGWKPARPVDGILEEIAAHAQAHPAWLEISAPL
jgi:CDP-paratose 2-epimerase